MRLHQTKVEDDSISTFVELVVKLNEVSFKPLFRKLFDWAFAASGEWQKPDPSCVERLTM